MPRYDEIGLVSQTSTVGDYGVITNTETVKTVKCEVSYVGQTERFEGGRQGLTPEFRFRVFAGDYSGEEICVYRDKRYSIYRAGNSENPDYIWLYVEKRKGTA